MNITDRFQLRHLLVLLLLIAGILSILATGGGGGNGSAPTGTAALSWSPPTTNTDGSPVSLTGFNIYVGTSLSGLQPVRMVSAIEMTTVINGLAPGTYFFAVTAISTTGAESTFSNIASKTISF